MDFRTGDVHALDFADGTFDVVHAHQVLQHVADPVQALREMRRVCRPGGVVAARDSDYAAMTWYPAVPELDEWLALYQRVARHNGGEPDAGRRLLAWARAAGFADVDRATAGTWCYADDGGPAVVERHLGRPDRRLGDRRAGRGVRVRHPRRPGAHRGRLAGRGATPRTAGSPSCTARSSAALRPP